MTFSLRYSWISERQQGGKTHAREKASYLAQEKRKNKEQKKNIMKKKTREQIKIKITKKEIKYNFNRSDGI